MPKKRYTPEEIVAKLRQVDVLVSQGQNIADAIRQIMLEKAVRICDAEFGNIYRWDGKALHLVATHNTPSAFAETRRRFPLRPRAVALIGPMFVRRYVRGRITVPVLIVIRRSRQLTGPIERGRSARRVETKKILKRV